MLVWFTHLLNFIIIDMHFKQSTVLATESQIRQNESESFRILIHQMEETFKLKSKSMVGHQGRNYHWGRRGSCLVRFSQKKKKKENESERERKRAKDKISITALLKGIFGMWYLSGFIFVLDVGCFSFSFCSQSDVGSFITDIPPY